MGSDSYVTSVNPTMTLSAKAGEIVGRIIQFIAVNMVNVKMYPPPLTLFAASLASPVVAVFSAPAKGFPVMGVIPFCYPSLPGRVIRPTNRTAESKRLSLCADRNIKLYQKLFDCGVSYSKLRSYIPYRPVFFEILRLKPVLMFIWQILAVVTFNIDIPVVLALVPGNRIAASAFTKRRIAPREVLDWLASLTPGMGFFSIPRRYSVALENDLNSSFRIAKFSSNRSDADPGSIAGRSCIAVNNLLLGFCVNTLHHSPTGGMV